MNRRGFFGLLAGAAALLTGRAHSKPVTYGFPKELPADHKITEAGRWCVCDLRSGGSVTKLDADTDFYECRRCAGLVSAMQLVEDWGGAGLRITGRDERGRVVIDFMPMRLTDSGQNAIGRIVPP